jgi:hypothetical protein
MMIRFEARTTFVPVRFRDFSTASCLRMVMKVLCSF